MLETFFEEHSIQYFQLTKKETWKLQQKWRETFSKIIKEKKGKWIYGDYNWHTFSFDFAIHKLGARAIELYKNVSSKEYYVLSEKDDNLGYKCCSKTLHDLSAFGDYYVFPEDMEWTMAFTHEQSIGLGPYFALKQWQ